MGWNKNRNGRWEVYVYRPTKTRMVYVGTRPKEREAKALFREKEIEFQREARGEKPLELWTFADFAEYWLEHKHGPNTKRPARTTYALNESSLRPAITEFGDRLMTSIRRREALHFAGQYPRAAATAAAMFRDAVDEEVVPQNVFANRGMRQPKGRQDIVPLTEGEVDELARIARGHFEGYGEMCAAWILFIAWTGCRPGEAFQASWDDVDLDAGLFTVRRVKPPYRTQTVILPPRACEALRGMPRRAHPDGLVFTTIRGKKLTKGAWNFYWGPARKTFLSKLKDRDPVRHDALTAIKGATDLYALRHFCASWMVEHGSNEFDGAEQLGNTPEVFRRVYMHAHETDVRARNRSVFEKATVTDLDAVRQRRAEGA